MQHMFRAGAAARCWVGPLFATVVTAAMGCGADGPTERAHPIAVGPIASAGGPAPAVTPPSPNTGPTPGPTAPIATPGPQAGDGDGRTPAPAPTGTPTSTQAGDFCDVLPVAQAKCQACHGAQTKAGAPMSLVVHEDFTKPSVVDPSRTVAEAIKLRIHDTQRPMPPATAMALSPAELATIDAWIDGGALAPTGQCTTAAEPPTDMTKGDQPFPACDDVFEIRSSGNTGRPHTIGANSEIHPKIIMDAPWGNKDAWVLGWHPINDNEKVLHHWILYEAGGFDGKFLIGWAYGQGGENNPDGVGTFVPKGPGSLMLDMHYYNLGNSSAEQDNSGLEVCVTYTEPQNVATTIGLGALPAVGPGQRVDNSAQCTVSMPAGTTVKLMSVAPHMHKLGVNGKLELIRNGQTTVVHDAPFTFGDQTLYKIDVDLMNGDVLKTTCTYDNTTSRRVGFGQNSDDEMCFNFVEYYPMGAFQCLGGGFNI